MAWNAKPSGGYLLSSNEGTANALEMNSYLQSAGYTIESSCAVIGNSMSEGGLNPWRWQSDTYNLNGGYGLFQYTPASGYISNATSAPYFSPNLSTSQATVGATPEDGIAQLFTMDTNLLGKWVSSCWRSYWNPADYPDEFALREYILNTYGNGSSLSMQQFRDMPDMYCATFAFLACFEGPGGLHLSARYANASAVYTLLTGQPAPPPTPITNNKKMPIWMMLRYGL